MRVVVFVTALLPLAWLAWGAVSNTLGPDPQEVLLHETGIWALRFLLLTLLATPLRRWLGWSWLLRYRRMLGLFAFFYVSVHLFLFWATELQLDPVKLWHELGTRWYFFIGFSAWLLLLTLAATSFRRLQRQLGPAWKRIHRAVYPAAGLAVIHFWLAVKADWLEPLVYALLLIFLLALRFERVGVALKLRYPASFRQ